MAGEQVPRFWPTEARTALPGAADLPAFLDSVNFAVPARTEGRSKGHHEGHCIIRALRWLSARDPSAFPATLLRIESPDSVLVPNGGAKTWAFEHTDAGEQQYQHWLAQAEDRAGMEFLPSPGGDGWIGNAPERAFAAAIGRAIGRKAQSRFWRNAPSDAVRCILAYDQTNTGLFVSDAAAEVALCSAVAATPAAQGTPVLGMLLRGTTAVLFTGDTE